MEKSTELKANSPLLIQPFEDLVCDNSHEPETLNHGKAEAAKLWTWEMCNRMVDGIILFKTELEAQRHAAYPAYGAPPAAAKAARRDWLLQEKDQVLMIGRAAWSCSLPLWWSCRHRIRTA